MSIRMMGTGSIEGRPCFIDEIGQGNITAPSPLRASGSAGHAHLLLAQTEPLPSQDETFRVCFQLSTIRKIVLNACDGEVAIGLAQTDHFSSKTVAAILGHLVAQPERNDPRAG
jgi:hypothetical protein